MNPISFGGLASGLDTNAIVNSLVGLERQTVQRTERRRGETQKAISDYSTLRSRLESLRGVAKEMADPKTFGRMKIESSDPAALTATADGTAMVGRWQIRINQLAQASRVMSDAQSDQHAALGTGTLRITVDGVTTPISVENGMSLVGLKDAINGAGVAATASIASDAAGFRLIVSGTQTGQEHAVSFQESGSLRLDLSRAGNRLSSAQDAQITVDNRLNLESSTNTFDGDIEGLALTLTGSTTGQTVNLNLSRDAQAQGDAIERFVGAFNEVVDFIQSKVKPAEIGQRTMLVNDTTMTSARKALRDTLKALVPNGSTFDSAARIGLTTTSTGQLKLDRAQLSRAMEADLDGTLSIFTQDGDGLADRFDEAINGMLEAGGPLDSRKGSLDRRVRDLNRQIDAQNRRVDAFELRLRAQFQSMEQLVSRLNDQSSMLQSRIGIF